MDQRVQIVVALLEENLRRKPPLAEMARVVNLSPSRLRHLFKAETGMTPAQYFKFLRMQKAKELLGTTFLGVKVIMARVGINNESHFMRDFKKAYGVTPAQYRRGITAPSAANKPH